MAEWVTVVGGGLAGSEAAWQIARRGVPVRLYEMRPVRPTPVHRTGRLAELVCSNSLKSLELSTAHGLLKEEMTRLGSMILEEAKTSRVPAGGALAVDRDAFAGGVTARLQAEPLVELIREEVPSIPEDGIVVLAVGPMVSERLAASIAAFTGQEHLYFFDAIAPVVEAESIDRSIVFSLSRYGKGGGDDYLNCPLDETEYERFVDELLAGEKAPLHDVDSTPFFEGCLPIEEMARRGRNTLAFGPMKPVGLTDPRTGRETVTLPENTMLGALCHYISHARPQGYQPTNAAFGLLPEAPTRARRKRERRLARSAAALEALDAWVARSGEETTVGDAS
jgi:methylenetetrahydrofolate--tRNA-(uracil-5-)-methyltransferase